MEITPQERAKMQLVRNEFVKMMNRLTPQQQSDRAQVIASGIRRADPLTRALAEQFVKFERIRDGITAKEKQIEEIERDVATGGYRPRDPEWKGRALTRKADLETEIKMDHARAFALREDPLRKPEREAVEQFRAEQAAAARNERINEAVARKTAEAEQADIDALADRIVSGRRADRGIRTNGDAQ
jgi:hypothetical protein